MIVGLGNLLELKTHLLAESVRYQNTYDTQLIALGRGVAGLMERHCNRKFQRTEDALDVLTADHGLWVLRRYPVESVSKVEINSGDGWEEQDDSVLHIDNDAGIARFNSYLGDYTTLARITYTGGYWIEDAVLRLEEDGTVRLEEDGTPRLEEIDPIPDGATALPDDLKCAWLLQCEYVWGQRDKLGFGLAQKPEAFGKLAQVGLVPMVESSLCQFRRYQMI